MLDDLEAEADNTFATSSDFHHLGHGIGCQARLAPEDRTKVGALCRLVVAKAPAGYLRISLSGQVLAVFEKAFAEEMARLSGS